MYKEDKMRDNNTTRNDRKLLQAWISEEAYNKIQKISDENKISKGAVIQLIINDTDENLYIRINN